MRLPIDTQHLNFIAVGIPEAVVDFDTKQRHDPDGRASIRFPSWQSVEKGPTS
jgi:hypothetical protein